METVLKDCFWCGESYPIQTTACPKCATDTTAMNKRTQQHSGEVM